MVTDERNTSSSTTCNGICCWKSREPRHWSGRVLFLSSSRWGVNLGLMILGLSKALSEEERSWHDFCCQSIKDLAVPPARVRRPFIRNLNWG
ncbi:hypothetical protein ACLOJK_014654 [Asimina triloba]